MTKIDKHPAGSFCWIELATTDQSAAKKFYTSLFGWSANDNPMGPAGVYTIFQLNGRDVAAGYTRRKGQLDRGVPVHWSLYIAVENTDQAAAKAKQAGGSILMPPFDVTDVGRMAVIHDPTGAVFSMWQPKKSQGIGVAGENNALCWADLSTPDPARAQKFYSDVFGWKLDKSERGNSGYLHIKNGEQHIGGILPVAHRDPKSPAHWLIYIMVADVDAAVTKAKQLGGKTLMPPQSIEGVGTWAILADPQGAVFSAFKSAR